MQLIKDFADIPRFVGFLNSEYQQKLLTEINTLLVKFMDEQTRVPSQENKINDINPEPQKPAPIIEKPSFQSIQNISHQSIDEAKSGISNLKNNFKHTANNLPPPPVQTIAAVPLNMTRSITAAPLNVKTNISSNVAAKIQSKKPTMSLVDSWSFIIPYITETGITDAQKPSIKMDTYQLMKHIDNSSTLKEVYLYLYPMSNPWARFLETLYPLYRERSILLKKTKDFPLDTEIPLRLGDYFLSKGLINNSDLEKAIEYQKNPQPNVSTKVEPMSQINSGNWIDRAKSLMEKVEKPQSQQYAGGKRKIGEIFIELNMVTKEELDDALTIQKWIRNLLDFAK